MSSSSSSSSLQRSNELGHITSPSTINTNPISFAPLHRTAELENLHDHINNDDEKQIPSSTTTTTPSKKVLTKCITVIGDGSDKRIQ